jgi:hypothetical protein
MQKIIAMLIVMLICGGCIVPWGPAAKKDFITAQDQHGKEVTVKEDRMLEVDGNYDIDNDTVPDRIFFRAYTEVK